MTLVFIIILAIVAVAFLYIIINNYQSTKLYKKIIALVIIIIIIAGIVAYSINQSKFDTHVQNMQLAFERGSTLICSFNNQEIRVNKEDFRFLSTSLSFVGKDKLQGYVIDLQKCTKIIPPSTDVEPTESTVIRD
ncbi:hypothetical protein BKH43_07960 [Helicobacter sp. 13S00401-1]|uniref:hypothetical protein n=1 Tax=Helicobacter sp. 13S00401-1 TaxID=1905758 RepID=UPI000BA56A06|nr:hypothetical protein [Helicobacter sp. 13S00401-1]PAF48211.1 hypothetical protein BKH43_07960 [Helicobacter sp. 13S00401-1]